MMKNAKNTLQEFVRVRGYLISLCIFVSFARGKRYFTYHYERRLLQLQQFI